MATATTTMLKTLTIPNTDTQLPGTVDTEALVLLGQGSRFATQAVIKELIRFWHIANARTQLAPHQRMYGKAIAQLGHDQPGLVMYAEPISQEDFEAVTGTEEEG